MFRKKNREKIVFHGHPCIHLSLLTELSVKFVPFFHHNCSHPGAKFPTLQEVLELVWWETGAVQVQVPSTET